MRNYLIRESDSYQLPLIGGVTFSTGDGLETSQRYGYDYSKRPQSLVFRKRNTAFTASIQLTFNAQQCEEYEKELMGYIAELESICGERCAVFWNESDFGAFIITQVQFSAQCDPLSIFPSVSVSLSLTEGYKKHETLYAQVGTLEKASK